MDRRYLLSILVIAIGGRASQPTRDIPSRSIADIKLVFERNKDAIYAIYNHALREDPTLQGKVVVQVKVAPSGQVTDCRVVTSELPDRFVDTVVARVKQFDFGAKDVAPIVITWPLDFVPK
jgi:TonB family protein